MNRFMTLILVALTVLVGAFATTSSASAATLQPDAPHVAVANQTGELETKITDLTDSLSSLGRPITILSVILALLFTVGEPALPEFARENKGVIRRVLFAAIFIGMVPDLVNFFMGA